MAAKYAQQEARDECNISKKYTPKGTKVIHDVKKEQTGFVGKANAEISPKFESTKWNVDRNPSEYRHPNETRNHCAFRLERTPRWTSILDEPKTLKFY